LSASKQSDQERSQGPRDLFLSAESVLAKGVTTVICALHRRRLRQNGWAGVLEAAGGWAAGEPPPRDGNNLEILIDGAEALPRIADELKQARSHIHLAGWYFSPDFALLREREPEVLRNLLADLAERVEVRVLAWAGAPLPLFRPSRRQVKQMRERLIGNTKIHCALDAHERPMHCHHEKTIVIDDRVAFVGGIDLTAEAGDRHDTNDHPARASVGWHDASARIEGPAVSDVAEHFRMRWQEVTGETLPPVAAQPRIGGVELQIVRTIPERTYKAVPQGDFRILESYVRALRSAQRFIYLENQFLWSPEIAAILADKLSHPPDPNFRLVVLLPAKPNNGSDDTRGVLSELIRADNGNGHLVACTLYAREGTLHDQIYVHAKIGIVDDAWLTLGSANLNEHSLFNDTEINITTHDPATATATRRRLWAEHLELTLDELPDNPTETIDKYWKPISTEQLERRNTGQPLTHRLVRLPNVSKRSGRILGPLNGLLVDG
jgi:phosphatidylserine/phosphatidylglycerophosphate/cardiolipin synthase-like enzyme